LGGARLLFWREALMANDCDASDEKKKNRGEVVRDLLAAVERKLTESDVKVTLADYIRLVQLQKDLEQEEPREIRVRWVDHESESSSEK
jgi:signal recognition particle GTPase